MKINKKRISSTDKKNEINSISTKQLSVVDEMSSRISHDLKNPLCTIKLSIDLIKETDSNMNKESLEHLVIIDKMILNMTHQINKLLNPNE